MNMRKTIEVRTNDLVAICIGFVGFSPEHEGLQLALDLLNRWNPLLFDALSKIAPDIDVKAINVNSISEAVDVFKEQENVYYSNSDIIVQSGRLQIRKRSSGTDSYVDILLCTYWRRKSEKMTIIAGEDLTLVPV